MITTVLLVISGDESFLMLIWDPIVPEQHAAFADDHAG